MRENLNEIIWKNTCHQYLFFVSKIIWMKKYMLIFYSRWTNWCHTWGWCGSFAEYVQKMCNSCQKEKIIAVEILIFIIFNIVWFVSIIRSYDRIAFVFRSDLMYINSWFSFLSRLWEIFIFKMVSRARFFFGFCRQG